ncbi:bifunctional metallophosphatase/5'-nucleotidase [Reinekea blandensis]|uniref:5'-nucleotidase/2',3'-cyclic phosphodiesterase and related esterase n=1 Tax=Reinekea blandensis MED297 TaxID=314283 RepID=A4BH02_9GAMM|nr:bifunctional UDP-sugar hydrolase/5'-nucleotidase [Reinekea blandensis]EAR08648.1 5'-nucleotidase/2',3'-cyclic phosphodiesterase and related esterase [Reinekea sp. MED297] [Reinekea blandensis MED297]
MNKQLIFSTLLTSALLTACHPAPETTKPLSVTLLHVGDSLSNINAKEMELTVAGNRYLANVGGAARTIQALETLSEQNEHTLRFHSGNAITGNSYYTLFEGKADAEVTKLACYDAIGIGSHDFNAGEPALKEFLNGVDRGPCVTTYLGSNIEFKAGDSPLARIQKDDTVIPVILKMVEDEAVGILSINPSEKTQNSSSPLESTRFHDEVKTAQKLINQLHKSDVNKIVVLSQLGFERDLDLASALKGVDIILGAGSHTLMGNWTEISETSSLSYPTKTQDADGNPVCIAYAWNHYSAVGELHVNWDNLGVVSNCQGTLHVLVDAPHEIAGSNGEFSPISDFQQAMVVKSLQSKSRLIPVSEQEQTKNMIAHFNSQIERIESRVIATVQDNLCLERIPGEGRSKICSAAETRQHGSVITPLVAEAFMKAVKTSDAAIQNAGGVRTDISMGELTVGHAQNLLPFNNLIIELSMTGEEIKSVLEEAVAYSVDENGTTGGFPYAAGLRWDLDMSQPRGQRLSNLQINPQFTNTWQDIDPRETYRIATNNYIALGRDGYETFGKVVRDGRYQDTYIYYTQAFVDFARNQGTLKPMAPANRPVQSIKGL